VHNFVMKYSSVKLRYTPNTRLKKETSGIL